MKKEAKVLLLLLSVVTIFIIVIIFSQHFLNSQSEVGKSHIEKFKIQFKGQIMKSKKTDRVHMICVKLAYTNVDSIYSRDESLGLKIKNGTAVFAIGSDLIDYYKVDYVEVNMNNDGKEKFYSKGRLVETYDTLFLGGGRLTEEDMNVCD